ncbi:hypothetical protein [Flavobacterium muglaense]|uniref:Uncharacterized protein n=1 Tax=Flavobacterium muglaense TaxID=2764716 RepID=A0A923MW82_9FLAO|nr:hypothetical protein [Flavobacterium muglaense]MBC5836401.1 hypothetical protein [Flavobacterium muglaense]MBC5842931.1 hypothetical protein [Flavobacterium muglaense]
MINQLREAFPQIEINCLTTIIDKHTFVFECPEFKKGLFVNATKKYHLHIQNNINSQFYFIQNDDCVMKTVKGGQCDYVILNDFSIYFTEIKATKENLSVRRKKGLQQLENTIKFYLNKIDSINLENKNALICFDNNKRIAPQASVSSKRKEFKNKYQINLQEGNYILFE